MHPFMARVVFRPPTGPLHAPLCRCDSRAESATVTRRVWPINYMTPEIYHGIGDVVGDSLQLAIAATQTDADVIVQCGVHFMPKRQRF